jgi:hypothetical protein
VYLVVRLGQAYALAGRPQDAIEILEQGREVAVSSASRMVEPLILAHLANAHRLAGETQPACNIVQQAVSLANEVGVHGAGAWAMYFRGCIMAEQDPVESNRCYLRGIELADALGMRPLSAHCHFALGKLASENCQQAQARKHVNIALSAYRDMKMPFWIDQAEAFAASQPH